MVADPVSTCSYNTSSRTCTGSSDRSPQQQPWGSLATDSDRHSFSSSVLVPHLNLKDSLPLADASSVSPSMRDRADKSPDFSQPGNLPCGSGSRRNAQGRFDLPRALGDCSSRSYLGKRGYANTGLGMKPRTMPDWQAIFTSDSAPPTSTMMRVAGDFSRVPSFSLSARSSTTTDRMSKDSETMTCATFQTLN
jgi:hypothetical protein